MFTQQNPFTLNNRHFSRHQSTPHCICYVNSIELEQWSSCSPTFSSQKAHFEDYVQVMWYKSEDYKRMDNFPTIRDLQMPISAVELCHFHVAENKTPLPRHRGTFHAEWKAVPGEIIGFPQATTHQLSLLLLRLLDTNNFLRTWKSKTDRDLT